MSGPDAFAESLHIVRPLPGVEMWAVRGIQRGITMITPGYMFSLPDKGWRQRVGADTWYREAVRSISGGHVVLLDPGEVHRPTRLVPGFDAHALFVDPTMIDHYDDCTRRGPRRLARWSTAHPDAQRAFTRAWRAIETEDVDEVERESEVRAFLHAAFVHGDDLPRQRPSRACEHAVKRVRTLIEDRYAERLTLSELAKVADVSVFHLERSFTLELGVPVHRFLKMVRVRRAMTLLRCGQTGAETSASCGFSDESHMSRTFRLLLGVTPGQYRG